MKLLELKKRIDELVENHNDPEKSIDDVEIKVVTITGSTWDEIKDISDISMRELDWVGNVYVIQSEVDHLVAKEDVKDFIGYLEESWGDIEQRMEKLKILVEHDPF